MQQVHDLIISDCCQSRTGASWGLAVPGGKLTAAPWSIQNWCARTWPRSSCLSHSNFRLHAV